ncbi:hypothetical protein [Citrobacter amalonaticus]|uniref:hypothetical protein n=1 Tax=Citrobacter amalonaticus TaxID=35703 RepID=UPI0028C195C3|nr:hypothetical protein [Citrobacter amalonaticus]HED1903299.1 hypothetical protein [Citrobacter farmeri]
MTDITELAQREKFEAWAEERCALPWGYLKNRRTASGNYSVQIYTYMWQAWNACHEALLDDLDAAHELVELQRFKLERQAEDLHQAKSLENIHQEKRFEVEREFSDYKHRAESNSMRLAKEVCRLEDELQAAGIGKGGQV